MEQNNRDSKSLLLLLFPIGLLFLSLVVLFGLGFRFYFKDQTPPQATVIIKKDSAAVAVGVRDSLQKIYTATINELDNRLDSIWNNTDTLAGNLDIKLNEFYKLRKEITSLLKSGGNKNDFGIACKKIGELQQKVEELSRRNQDVENENKRLNDILSQLKNNTKTQQPAVVRNVTENKPVTERTFTENKSVAEVKTVAQKNAATNSTPVVTSFTASDIRLSAVKLSDEKEEETADAGQAEKLVATFQVKNNFNQYNNTEVDVVVMQPDGTVLQPSAWETGTFNTPEGKKIYSGKMRFEYSKGENKKLRLSLSSEKFQQGNYIMHLYHNGTLIGKTVKQLS